ncbi:MAG: UbiA family prenyltransferase [Gammaproteobacteria bacterium]|nr:UbiA family prenyltransferase [Gammaproteobacteria bacterium]
MKLFTLFKLGRVSNLPTVWSNVLAGSALANAEINQFSLLIVLVSMSLVYTAGMFFNDVFDQDYDRQFRSDRPIPANDISSSVVMFLAISMMILALLLLSLNISVSIVETWYPVLSCVLLCGLVLLYDWRHKQNPFGPLIMGLCRGMVYITAAVSVIPALTLQLAISAICLTVWVLGLTMVAKNKNVLAGFILLNVSVNVVLLVALNDILSFQGYIAIAAFAFTLIYVFVYQWKNDKYWNSVTLLIASICLLDVLVIVSVTGAFNNLAMASAGLFFLTLFFQRVIEGS